MIDEWRRKVAQEFCSLPCDIPIYSYFYALNRETDSESGWLSWIFQRITPPKPADEVTRHSASDDTSTQSSKTSRIYFASGCT